MAHSLQDELIQKDAHIAKLAEQKLALEVQWGQAEESTKGLESQLLDAREKIDQLQLKLSTMPSKSDFENLKKRLETMEDIDCSYTEPEEPEGDSKPQQSDKQTRQLKSELAKARMQVYAGEWSRPRAALCLGAAVVAAHLTCHRGGGFRGEGVSGTAGASSIGLPA